MFQFPSWLTGLPGVLIILVTCSVLQSIVQMLFSIECFSKTHENARTKCSMEKLKNIGPQIVMALMCLSCVISLIIATSRR